MKQAASLLAFLLTGALAAMLLAPASVSAAAASPVEASPTRGMTMAEVRARFGDPERILPPDPATAQGPLKPPINRWIYPDFTVYFERNVVIHTVWRHPRKAPAITTAPGAR